MILIQGSKNTKIKGEDLQLKDINEHKLNKIETKQKKKKKWQS